MSTSEAPKPWTLSEEKRKAGFCIDSSSGNFKSLSCYKEMERQIANLRARNSFNENEAHYATP